MLPRSPTLDSLGSTCFLSLEKTGSTGLPQEVGKEHETMISLTLKSGQACTSCPVPAPHSLSPSLPRVLPTMVSGTTRLQVAPAASLRFSLCSSPARTPAHQRSSWSNLPNKSQAPPFPPLHQPVQAVSSLTWTLQGFLTSSPPPLLP